jgi:signal transduction histidine kinase
LLKGLDPRFDLAITTLHKSWAFVYSNQGTALLGRRSSRSRGTRRSTAISARDESAAWRWLAVSAIQALAVTRADRVADAQQATFQRQMVQDREDFLALVAHELKTPVAVVKAYAELLEVQMVEAVLADQPRRAIAEVVEHVSRAG